MWNSFQFDPYNNETKTTKQNRADHRLYVSISGCVCCSETIFIIIILCVVAITLPISIIYKTICNKNYFNRQCRVVVFISANIFLWLCYCRWRCRSPCLVLVFFTEIVKRLRCCVYSLRQKNEDKEWTNKKKTIQHSTDYSNSKSLVVIYQHVFWISIN